MTGSGSTSNDTAPQDAAARAHAIAEDLVELRREFHREPELSFHEFKTSAKIAGLLDEIPGLKVQRKVAGTGVVATLGSGARPRVALRADMDALPIQETNEHDFVSIHPGVMHACGHDAHTSMLIGAARLLAEQHAKKKLNGTVKFVFQPAEEIAGPDGRTGAQIMLDEGVYDDVDAALAIHVNPRIPAFSLLTTAGPVMASVDYFEATIKGRGGHGGSPHNALDPTWMLGVVLQALHGIVARRVNPLDACAISIGTINAGTMNSIIPETVHITGTIRSYSSESREMMLEQVQNAFELTRALGGDYDLVLTPGEPVTENHPEVTRRIQDAFQRLFPYFELHDKPFGLEGEDFGHVTQRLPGAIFFVGAGYENPGATSDLHTPNFGIDERCLPVGTAMFVEVANSILEDWNLEEE